MRKTLTRLEPAQALFANTKHEPGTQEAAMAMSSFSLFVLPANC
jgi:hypothetical protein